MTNNNFCQLRLHHNKSGNSLFACRYGSKTVVPSGANRRKWGLMVTPTLPMDLQGRPKEGPQFQETHLPLWEGTWPPLQQPAGSPLKVSFQLRSCKNHSPLALQYVLAIYMYLMRPIFTFQHFIFPIYPYHAQKTKIKRQN